jgi:hypothetical protein
VELATQENGRPRIPKLTEFMIAQLAFSSNAAVVIESHYAANWTRAKVGRDLRQLHPPSPRLPRPGEIRIPGNFTALGAAPGARICASPAPYRHRSRGFLAVQLAPVVTPRLGATKAYEHDADRGAVKSFPRR